MFIFIVYFWAHNVCLILLSVHFNVELARELLSAAACAARLGNDVLTTQLGVQELHLFLLILLKRFIRVVCFYEEWHKWNLENML